MSQVWGSHVQTQSPGQRWLSPAVLPTTGCDHTLTGGLNHPWDPLTLLPPLPPAALCLVLGCMIFPDGWDAETIRDMCGEKTGKYSLGDCSVRWAYILAIIGILNALILSFLAFVLGNRQNDLLHEELKTESKGEHRRARGLGQVRVSWAELAQRGCGGAGGRAPALPDTLSSVSTDFVGIAVSPERHHPVPQP